MRCQDRVAILRNVWDSSKRWEGKAGDQTPHHLPTLPTPGQITRPSVRKSAGRRPWRPQVPWGLCSVCRQGQKTLLRVSEGDEVLTYPKRGHLTASGQWTWSPALWPWWQPGRVDRDDLRHGLRNHSVPRGWDSWAASGAPAWCVSQETKKSVTHEQTAEVSHHHGKSRVLHPGPSSEAGTDWWKGGSPCGRALWCHPSTHDKNSFPSGT